MTDRQTRASCWSVTINNPTEADEEQIAIARQKGWSVLGQKEKGEQGTEHYQLMVKTPQVRFSAVKKAFPRGHIEIARNPTALANYVEKEDTRVAPLATQQSSYPSQQQVWSWFAEYCPSEQSLDNDYKEYSMCVVRENDKLVSKFEWKQSRLLDAFDDMIRAKVSEGYYVELIGVNPQVRSAVKNYGLAIRSRELNKMLPDNITEDASVNEGS